MMFGENPNINLIVTGVLNLKPVIDVVFNQRKLTFLLTEKRYFEKEDRLVYNKNI